MLLPDERGRNDVSRQVPEMEDAYAVFGRAATPAEDTGSEKEYLKASKYAAYAVIKSLKTQEKDGIKTSTKVAAVSTGGKRNETPLNDYQINMLQGYKGEILYSAHSNTSFHGSQEGEKYHFLVIGTDAFPAGANGGSANEKVSLNGCMVQGYYAKQ